MKSQDQTAGVYTPDYSGDPQLARLVAAWENMSAAAGYQVSLEDALSHLRADGEEREEELWLLERWREHRDQDAVEDLL